MKNAKKANRAQRKEKKKSSFKMIYEGVKIPKGQFIFAIVITMFNYFLFSMTTDSAAKIVAGDIEDFSVVISWAALHIVAYLLTIFEVSGTLMTLRVVNGVQVKLWNHVVRLPIESAESNTLQKAYQLRIMTKEDCLYDSGVVISRDCVGMKISARLLPLSEYTAKLTVWDNHGCREETESTFETGRWDTPWQAHWITGAGELDDDAVLPTYHFRKEIQIRKPVKKARLYASALGCYTVSIGGMEVSAEYFAPGYAQYTQRILYNTYSVTRLLQEGVQNICAEVSGGWYCGRLGLSLKGNNFGKKRAFGLTC